MSRKTEPAKYLYKPQPVAPFLKTEKKVERILSVISDGKPKVELAMECWRRNAAWQASFHNECCVCHHSPQTQTDGQLCSGDAIEVSVAGEDWRDTGSERREIFFVCACCVEDTSEATTAKAIEALGLKHVEHT